MNYKDVRRKVEGHVYGRSTRWAKGPTFRGAHVALDIPLGSVAFDHDVISVKESEV